MAVKSFTGKYRWLSNFYPCEVQGPGGFRYPTVEHAYQAWKTNDQKEWVVLASKALTPYPGDAKRHGRKLTLRPDWESIKLTVMENLLRQKFMSGTDLCERLCETGEEDIIEGNTWGDIFWGVCNGVGQNMMGHLLMKIRDEHNRKQW